MTAIMVARAVQLGEAKVIVVGGMEHMSRALYRLGKVRTGRFLMEELDEVALESFRRTGEAVGSGAYPNEARQ